MPASVEDRMRKLGFPGTKPPDTIPTQESKPEMAKKKPHVLEELPSLGSDSKSNKRSSRKKGSR